MNTDTITERRGWLKNFSKRTLVIGGMVGALILVTAAISIAAILLRANVSGGVDATGAAVAFEWSDNAGSADATLLTRYATDGDSDGNFDGAIAIPAPLVCIAEIVGGELQVDMTGGWLPNESCVIYDANLNNPSSVNVAVVAWSFGPSGDLGLKDSGSPMEVWIADDISTGSVDIGLPQTVDAGETVNVGRIYFYVDDGAEFSTAYTWDDSAVIGETTR